MRSHLARILPPLLLGATLVACNGEDDTSTDPGIDPPDNGGPSICWNPLDSMYYCILGGHHASAVDRIPSPLHC